MDVVSLCLTACLSGACLLGGRLLIHWFQLESYQFPGYFRTLRRNGLRGLLPGLALGVLVLLSAALSWSMSPGAMSWGRAAVTGLCALACGAFFHRAALKQRAKKPLVHTARMKRLLSVSFLVIWGLLLAVNALAGARAVWGLSIACALLPLLIALGGLLAWPIEKAISEMYFRDAQRILRARPDLIRIGITGSWGKTSVKFILGALLQEKYPTLITPASFNTPMGVTRVIRTMLEPGHRVFVAEMGARHVGDIKEMCRLVHPRMGLLTSVGPQHLDTFHTLERIKKTKYELMDAIPEEGSCFFADDDGIVLELYRKTGKEKYLAGLNAERDDVWAEDIRVSPEGSSFLLCMGEERIPCKTRLLGELNIRNITLCAAVCRKLGMTGQEIAHGIRELESVEHRLQLLRNPGGITVIDDAFNSNIRGATQAFEVLRDFPERRIVVTPGMVELGSREEEMNRAFGAAMAGCCDLAILVGKKRARAIAGGLRDKGMEEHRIVTVGSLAEATEYLATVARRGDTILFENDLPDHYNEG